MRELQERIPDLLILDAGLPGIDPGRFARELRSAHGKHVRLVAFVNSVRKSESDLLSAGFDAVIQKPVPLARLFRVLSELGMQQPAMADPAQQLARARRHVTEGERRIERLKAIVERLNGQGLPSADAQKILETFLQTQQLMREHLAFEEAHHGGPGPNAAESTDSMGA